MSSIKKKIHPKYFEPMANGKKNYEFRLNDFEVKEGDTLVLEEFDPKTKNYTGRKIERKVTYVGKFDLNNSFWPKEEILEKGIQIISLK